MCSAIVVQRIYNGIVRVRHSLSLNLYLILDIVCAVRLSLETNYCFVKVFIRAGQIP